MQQNTIMFERANPLQQLVGLARNMALPHEFAPTRFPSFPALERTAVMGFNVPTTITVPASGTRVMLCRQAAYPLWVETVGTPWAYSITLNSYFADRITAGGEYSLNSGLKNWVVGNQLASASTSGVTGQTKPLAGYPLIAYDMQTGPAPWFYVPTGGSIGVSLYVEAGGLPGSDPGMLLVFQRWVSPGEYTDVGDAISLSYTVGNISMSNIPAVLTGGWYRPFKATATTTTYAITNANFAITMTFANNLQVRSAIGTASVCATFAAGAAVTTLEPIAPPPEFANSSLPYMSTRTTAAAALFTNVTKALNKEGTVMGGRLNPAVVNPFLFTNSDLVGLHPAEKQLLGLETGSYTFCPPSTDLSEFWDYTLNTSMGASPAPVHRLDNNSMVNCLVFSDPDGGTNLAVNLDWHLEFRTSSALWQIGLSTVPIEVLHQAQLSLAAAGFFFQNDTHKDVLNAVLPVLKSAAGKLMPALAELNPLTKVAFMTGKALLSNRPKTGPKATSLAQSVKGPSPQQHQHKGKKNQKPPKKGGKGKHK